MDWLENLLQNFILPIAGAYLVAWLVHRTSNRMVAPFVRLSGYAPGQLRVRAGRQRTLHDLFSSVISFAGFLIATLFSLSFFVETDTLIWMIGLFSAGLGFAARPLISDFLTGIGFIFEDTYDVGDKVELLEIEGVIEALNLRTTLLRAPTGELYVIPNGEIRVVRNFSRGSFSTAKVKLHVHSQDLESVIGILEELGKQAVLEMPDLLSPWQIISTGDFGQHIELTLVVKTRFGRAADLRPQILAQVQRALTQAGVEMPVA